MFEQVIAQFNSDAFKKFVERTKKTHKLKGDTDDIMAFVVEELMENAKKQKKSAVSMGMEDSELEHMIIKADTYLPQWKKQKEKKPAETPKPINTDDYYFDKNGQKHRKKKTEPKPTPKPKAEPIRKKETPKAEPKQEKFSLKQLELFDL